MPFSDEYWEYLQNGSSVADPIIFIKDVSQTHGNLRSGEGFNHLTSCIAQIRVLPLSDSVSNAELRKGLEQTR